MNPETTDRVTTDLILGYPHNICGSCSASMSACGSYSIVQAKFFSHLSGGEGPLIVTEARFRIVTVLKVFEIFQNEFADTIRLRAPALLCKIGKATFSFRIELDGPSNCSGSLFGCWPNYRRELWRGESKSPDGDT